MSKLITSAEQYYESFNDGGITSADVSVDDCSKQPRKPNQKSSEALKQALDIRKFEIDLYWKRASYFWVLIGATLVAFIAIAVAKEASHRAELSVVISSLGLVFSCAWLAVNKGSKFWQENWEKHVDMLEDEHTGALYKTVFDSGKDFFSLGGSSYSVSKVNLVVSFYVVALWLCLLVASLVHMWCPSLSKSCVNHLITIGALFSVVFCGCFLFLGICRTKISFRDEYGNAGKAILRKHPLRPKSDI